MNSYKDSGVRPDNDLSRDITKGVRNARRITPTMLGNAFRKALVERPNLSFLLFKEEYTKEYWAKYRARKKLNKKKKKTV